jgi:hypothetical protein
VQGLAVENGGRLQNDRRGVGRFCRERMGATMVAAMTKPAKRARDKGFNFKKCR